MGKFAGKKLLLLGSSNASVDIIKYAKQEGAYIIVTDYLKDEESIAKQFADRTESISTVDIDNLTDYVKKNEIDAIFSGISEINLLSVQKIASATGLPCYFTLQQWSKCQDKKEFHDLCVANGINTPMEYEVTCEDDLKKILYPVIVKPVDCCAQVGIHVCEDEVSLKLAITDAKEKSKTHQIMIENFIEGQEIWARYIIHNGKAQLSCTVDTYKNHFKEGFMSLPEAHVCPSKNTSVFLKQCDSKIKSLITSLKIQDGTFWVQGIVKNKVVYIFEAALRLGGDMLYRFTEKINNTNTLHFLVDISFGISSNLDISLEDPYMKGMKCVVLNFFYKDGIIKHISDLKKIRSIEGVLSVECKVKEGEELQETGTISQTAIKIHIISKDIIEMKRIIEKVRDNVSIKDADGNELLYKEFAFLSKEDL